MSAGGAGDAWLVIDDDTALRLRPGRTFVARVVRSGGGRAVLALAGSLLEVAAAAPLAPGTTVRLEVTAVESGRVALRLLPGEAPTPGDESRGAGPRREGGVDRHA
jgi:hypothetical protein